jgi:hypothetical protein
MEFLVLILFLVDTGRQLPLKAAARGVRGRPILSEPGPPLLAGRALVEIAAGRAGGEKPSGACQTTARGPPWIGPVRPRVRVIGACSGAPHGLAVPGVPTGPGGPL